MTASVRRVSILHIFYLTSIVLSAHGADICGSSQCTLYPHTLSVLHQFTGTYMKQRKVETDLHLLRIKLRTSSTEGCALTNCAVPAPNSGAVVTKAKDYGRHVKKATSVIFSEKAFSTSHILNLILFVER